MIRHWSMLQGVLMVGLSSSQPQCHRKHIISSLLHCKPILHSKRYTFANDKCISLQRWTRYPMMFISYHQWISTCGREEGVCVLWLKYKSLVYPPIYALHEVKGIIPCSVRCSKGQRTINNQKCQLETSHSSTVLEYRLKTNKDVTFKTQPDIINKV